jgi:hypothetical protein
VATADLTVLALGRAGTSATDIRAVDRPDQTLDDKVRSVEDRLGGGDI